MIGIIISIYLIIGIITSFIGFRNSYVEIISYTINKKKQGYNNVSGFGIMKMFVELFMLQIIAIILWPIRLPFIIYYAIKGEI